MTDKSISMTPKTDQIDSDKEDKSLSKTNTKLLRLGEFWFYYKQNKGALMGLAIFSLILLTAIFANIIANFDPTEQFRDYILTPPSWSEGGSSQFLLGTDAVGRDIFSRLVFGSRYSLYIGCIVITLSLSVGILLGVFSGYFGGVFDVLVMRAMDIILAIPSLLMALVLVAILGPGLENAMIAIAVTYTPHYVRLARSQTLAEKNNDYVTASRTIGATKLRLMFKVILPNCLSPLIVQATLGFSTAVLDAASLGFLGMGAQPPTPEWGTMLSEAREFILTAWWVVTFPGLAILFTVLSINLIGDGLRDAFDPKLKRS